MTDGKGGNDEKNRSFSYGWAVDDRFERKGATILFIEDDGAVGTWDRM